MAQGIAEFLTTTEEPLHLLTKEERFGKPGTVYFHAGHHVIYRNRYATVIGIDYVSALEPFLYKVRLSTGIVIHRCAKYELISLEPPAAKPPK